MNNQVFFLIDGEELVLDMVLVEYNEAPIFFVCKNKENYFISSCIDLEKEQYLVARIDVLDLSKMLHGKLTMRKLILQAKHFWEISVSDEISNDIVERKSLEEISVDNLPYENEFFIVATIEIEKYVKKIDSILYGSGIWEKNTDYYFDNNSDLIQEQQIMERVIMVEICKSGIEYSEHNYTNNIINEKDYNEEISMKIDINNKNSKVKMHCKKDNVFFILAA